MSVEGQVLGVSTTGAGGGAIVSELANTGNPLIVGAVVGFALVVALGFATRLSLKA